MFYNFKLASDKVRKYKGDVTLTAPVGRIINTEAYGKTHT
jgi:hypothetical protein